MVLDIMDPANFIFKKESNQARGYRQSILNGKKRVLEKTVMRPHYICLDEEETRDFVSFVSREPKVAHPVRGYWKNLMSERFVNKRGQRIFVKQYFTGEGNIKGREGWNYEVMVKEDFDKLVLYFQN